MFNSADGVLNWAYNCASCPIVKTSSVNRLMGGGGGGVPNDLLLGLGVQDMHKQAETIIGMVNRLPDPAASACIAAKFGRKRSEEDLRILVYRGCDATGLGLGGYNSIYQILIIYFDRRGGGYRTVRKILGCRDQYAIMMKKCLFDTVDHIYYRAMSDLHETFQEHGLIRSAA